MQDKIHEQFTQNPSLRVLFFFDGLGSHREELTPWELDGVLFEEGSTRWLYLKQRLEYELAGKKVFLYFPFKKPEGSDWVSFPLLGLYTANRELEMDEVTRFMEQYELKTTQQQALVRKWHGQLGLKKTRQGLREILFFEKFTEENLYRGLISLALDFPVIREKTHCLARLLALGLDTDAADKALKRVDRLGLLEELLRWGNTWFDTNEAQLTTLTLQAWAEKLKYNVLLGSAVKPMSLDTYKRLHASRPGQMSRLQGLMADWRADASLREQIEPVFSRLAAGVDEAKILEWYGLEPEYGYVSPYMQELALRTALHDISGTPERARARLPFWLEQSKGRPLEGLFKFADQAAACEVLLQSLKDDFRMNSPKAFVEAYTDSWWQVDSCYRKAMTALSETPDPAYLHLAEAAQARLIERYDAFLIKLNREWMEMLHEKAFAFEDFDLPRQYHFFRHYLERTEVKTAVIISDALRYEAAAELQERLRADSKNEVELTALLSSLPSYTRLGMANLLPHQGALEVRPNKAENELDFFIGGVSTESSSNRRVILRKALDEAEVLTFKDFESLSSEQGRELFKMARLVYIYHNRIDAVGENQALEKDTFKAVDDALADIQKAVMRLFSWNVYNVVVTADHGFLFNNGKITETSRENVPKDERILKSDSRFLVSKPGFVYQDGYTVALQQAAGAESDLLLHLPRTINRFGVPGKGKQYVHGGASMQEMLVPVLQYRRNRKDDLSPVRWRLLNETALRISSGAVKLEFLQEQAIAEGLREVRLSAALYNAEGTMLSNEETVVLNHTATDPRTRMNSHILRLTATGSREKVCYLRLYDLMEDKSRLNPKIDKRLDNQASMEIDEF